MGNVNFLLKTTSRDDAQFTIEFFDEYEDDVKMISLMNIDSPYEVRLRGKERKRVKIDTDIDVSQMESHIESGDSWNMNIIIKSGGKNQKIMRLYEYTYTSFLLVFVNYRGITNFDRLKECR